MKKLTILCLFLSKFLITQAVLVPYRVGDKFGLSDEKGKLVVKPQYDGIEYLNNKYITNANYFKYTNVSVKMDTIMRYGKKKEVQEKKVYSYGLFNRDKLLIKDQACSDFLVYPHLIIASINPYHAEKCVLYNLKGRQLITEPVSSMYVNDTREVGYISRASDKHTLLSMFYRDERNNKTFSLAVYDNEKQEITQWLLTKVIAFKADETQKKKTFTGFTYRDEEGIHEKYIVFRNNAFEIISQNGLTPSEKEELSKNSLGYSSYGGGVKSDKEVQIRDFSDDHVAVPYDDVKGYSELDEVPLDKYPKTEQAKRKFTYYIKKRSDDSLFFVEPNAERFWYSDQKKIATYVKVPEGVSVIYINSQSPQQYEQLIYKKNSKYGILNRGVFTDAIYDSLLYFGSDFIAGIKKDSKLQFGIVKPDGQELLPVLYDSIKGNIQQAQYRDTDKKTKQSQFVLNDNKENSDYSKIYSPYWQRRETANAVYKNGKTGILDYSTNALILPVEYDIIAENATNYSGFRNSKYVILKKDGKYAITNLAYNSLIKKLELTNTTRPLFNYIPCFYMDDYYNVKGFKLFGLFDENGKGVGYANESGLEYFRNK